VIVDVGIYLPPLLRAERPYLDTQVRDAHGSTCIAFDLYSLRLNSCTLHRYDYRLSLLSVTQISDSNRHPALQKAYLRD
jgi:hypothetical protein